MEAKDHKKLAQFLLDLSDLPISALSKKAFVRGNIQPDKNPATYLHGWTYGRKWHGHNYTNILPIMEKLFASLEKKKRFGFRDFFRLGKLAHYMADSFTFAHNEAYTGNLHEHIDYETLLHERLGIMLDEIRQSGTQEIRDSKSAESAIPSAGLCGKRRQVPENSSQPINFALFLEMHEEYLENAGTCDTDCFYIFRAVTCVLALSIGKTTAFELEWKPQNRALTFPEEALQCLYQFYERSCLTSSGKKWARQIN